MTFTLEDLQNPLLEPSLFRSDLEGLLHDTHFPTDMLLRAATFRRGLVMAGLTRCTSSETLWRRPVNHDKVILVVGQAESDASLRLGGDSLRCNLVLLKAVCQAHSDAYIVYKPHPEVWARMPKAMVPTTCCSGAMNVRAMSPCRNCCPRSTRCTS